MNKYIIIYMCVCVMSMYVHDDDDDDDDEKVRRIMNHGEIFMM